MDPIDVCRVPVVTHDGTPAEQSSGKPNASTAHEATHAAHQDSSDSQSGGGVSAGGDISRSSNTGGKPPSGSGLTMDDVNIVGRDFKEGGSKGGDVSKGSGGGAPPAASSTSGKGEAAFSSSLAKAKLQESLGKGDADGKIEGGGLGAAAGAFGKFQPGGGVESAAGKIDSNLKFDGKFEGGSLGAAAGAAGKFDAGKVKADLNKPLDDKFGGELGMMDKFKDPGKFDPGLKDMPGGLPGAEKFGDAGGLGGKVAGMGDGSPEGGKFGKGTTGSGDTGYGDGWKKDSSYAGDLGKKDGKTGVGGKDDKTGGVGSGKDKTDSTKDTGKDDKKTESSDSGKKTESKTSSDKSDKTGTKETGDKEKDKRTPRGAAGAVRATRPASTTTATPIRWASGRTARRARCPRAKRWASTTAKGTAATPNLLKINSLQVSIFLLALFPSFS
jgi:hypothetical protein